MAQLADVENAGARESAGVMHLQCPCGSTISALTGIGLLTAVEDHIGGEHPRYQYQSTDGCLDVVAAPLSDQKAQLADEASKGRRLASRPSVSDIELRGQTVTCRAEARSPAGDA